MTLVRLGVTVVLCCSWAFTAAGTQNKRIITGGPLPNVRGPEVYQAIRYVVWIGDGLIAPTGWVMKTIVATPQHLWCTGVLITPDIVQTACSCVSFFIVDDRHYYRIRASVMSPWEERLQVFFGETRVRHMELFSKAKSYVVYNECAKVYLPTLDDPDRDFLSYIVHDYGLILMEKSVTGPPIAAISYAPQQPFEDIIAFYYEALQREYMCLFFGYGHVNETKTYGIPGWGTNSDYLRWGWRPLINYQDCYYATYKDPVNQKTIVDENVDFKYKEDATWMCANSIKPKSAPERFSTSPGDRGGPVTCNNVYLGILSNSFWFRTAHLHPANRRPRIKLSIIAPIVFSLWESSANYRESFIRDIHHKLKDGETFPDPFDEVIHWRPTYILFSSRSPGVSGSIHFILLFASVSELLP